MATSSFYKFDQFVEDLAKKVHNLSTDQMSVALTATLPTAGNAVLADIVSPVTANLSSLNVTTTSAEQTSGTLKFILADLVLTASGAVSNFRYVVLYNNTPTSPADPLIGWYDYGVGGVTLSNGETFTIDFDGTNGVFTLA